jgi:hypothetical protein
VSFEAKAFGVSRRLGNPRKYTLDSLRDGLVGWPWDCSDSESVLAYSLCSLSFFLLPAPVVYLPLVSSLSYVGSAPCLLSL